MCGLVRWLALEVASESAQSPERNMDSVALRFSSVWPQTRQVTCHGLYQPHKKKATSHGEVKHVKINRLHLTNLSVCCFLFSDRCASPVYLECSDQTSVFWTLTACGLDAPAIKLQCLRLP